MQIICPAIKRPSYELGIAWSGITALSEKGEGDAHPYGRGIAGPSVRSRDNHVRREHPLSDEQVILWQQIDSRSVA